MAQDFQAAFQVGESEAGITTIDADGVALAAIQGLNEKLEAQAAQLHTQQIELQSLKRRLAYWKRSSSIQPHQKTNIVKTVIRSKPP